MKSLSVCLALTLSQTAVFAADLADLNLEELTKAEVTSVSRRSQSINDVAAAAFVITAEDIRRSGALALPDVLRMAPGIQVAQIDSGRYAVTSRSFNGRFATKLQVLVDGRSLYHPLFAGVLWELDPVPLADIDRIEIIRGPGAVMWGANAVNGVINIITKRSNAKEPNTVSAAAGSRGLGQLYARIREDADEDTSWKLSVQGRQMGRSTTYEDESRKGVDKFDSGVVSFRLDRELGSGSDFSLWANAAQSATFEKWNTNPSFTPGGLVLSPYYPRQVVSSQSLVGRYRWLTDGGVESTFQASLAGSSIDITQFFKENRATIDLDYQGRYALGTHDIVWGVNHRTSQDNVWTNAPYVAISPNSAAVANTGFFLNDDWTLIDQTLRLGTGARVDATTGNGHNLSGNATLTWTPTRTDSTWLKAARAPRTSSRAERDVSILTGGSVINGLPIISYNDANQQNKLKAENSRGVEWGYRKQFSNNFSADLAAYRYRYTDLRTGTQSDLFGCSPLLVFAGIPFDPARCGYFGVAAGTMAAFTSTHTVNGLAAWNEGLELSADWLITPDWRLQLSASTARIKTDRSGDPVINADAAATQKGAPRHSASLRSQWNISSRQQLDVWLRGVGKYDLIKLVDTTSHTTAEPTYQHIPGYVTADFRYAYRVAKDVELAIVGRNLIAQHHLEFVSDFIPTDPSLVSRTIMFSTQIDF